ncbi:ATP-grasp domain-containing protein [Nonomuraea cavernae]|uniref:Carbamoyl phosphate synthase n=1 Tax=Nonomuraea cavernae TaxID=2045107 RepID=A0A917ZDF7_9ACTN|nr:ATP-grasp domain-containing protein [Nonomuraea cavernae]MCA2190375.1 ATP-grasp domain-containing protein [Nonomuraea cavernae]GGO80798.1 carbamoyl phosphate synthase [Nonomuraea cavernae]
MKRLVILGGSDGAISAFRAARRLGLTTVCVDMRADAPAVPEADEFLHVSTRDVDAVTAALRELDGVLGLLAPGSDVNLPALAAVAGRLGLPGGLPPAALRASTDKAYFREVCARLGMAGPAHVGGPAVDVLREAVRLDFPVIVKPVDSGSSRGITVCAAAPELAAAVQAAAAVSPTATVIAEELVVGRDLCGEAFLQDGRVALLGLSDRVVAPPHVVAIGHDMAPRDPELTAEVIRQLELVCAEVGYTDGPLNLDLFVTGDGVVLIEMGARIGGNGMGEALGLMYGVDTVAAAVLLAIGERPELTPGPARHASVRMLRADRAGTLVALDGVRAALDLPGVADVLVTVSPGERVAPLTECRAKLGYVLASGTSAGEVAGVLAAVEDLVRVGVDAG